MIIYCESLKQSLITYITEMWTAKFLFFLPCYFLVTVKKGTDVRLKCEVDNLNIQSNSLWHFLSLAVSLCHKRSGVRNLIVPSNKNAPLLILTLNYQSQQAIEECNFRSPDGESYKYSEKMNLKDGRIISLSEVRFGRLMFQTEARFEREEQKKNQ